MLACGATKQSPRCTISATFGEPILARLECSLQHGPNSRTRELAVCFGVHGRGASTQVVHIEAHGQVSRYGRLLRRRRAFPRARPSRATERRRRAVGYVPMPM